MANAPATIKDIARRLGLHHSTVSRALNYSRQIPPGTRAAVARVADELKYHPHHVARSLVLGKTGCIGLIVPSFGFISNVVVAQNLAGIGRAAEGRKYSLLFYTYSGEPLERVLEHALRQRLADGLIVIAGAVSAGMADLARQHAWPVVFFDCRGKRDDIYAVCSDNHNGCRRLIEHLATLGHRRIGAIVRDSYDAGRERLRGYHSALRSLGIPRDRALVGSLVKRTAADLCDAMLALENPPTALFCSEFRYTLLLLDHLAARGISVPRDMAVVSYDDIPLFDRIRPALTTVRQNPAELGRAAVEMLDTLIHGGTPPRRRLLVPTELVVRESCGSSAALASGKAGGEQHGELKMGHTPALAQAIANIGGGGAS